MRALERKAARDVWRMRGQVAAIGLVVACGVATFVMSLSTLDSLVRAVDTYYERSRFAEVFAHLERAPSSVAARLEAIPGVTHVQTRIVEHVVLDMPGMAEPATGRLISVPDARRPGLNELVLRRGSWLRPAARLDVLVTEAFADAHALEPGDVIPAVMNGRLERLTVAGIVMSPEIIYQIRDGELLPDDRRYGVLWMGRRQMAAAFDMEGAFNDVTATVAPGASMAEVIRRMDRILARFGGLGAYDRSDHVSDTFVSNEIAQLRGMTKIVPVIFLAVAAFLLNIVMARLVTTQRGQIAALKALGYGRRQIAWHYLSIMLVVVAGGSAVGAATGAWMGRGVTDMYRQFYQFPAIDHVLRPSTVVLGVAVAAVAGIAGTLGAVRRAAVLPPAEAMRPEPPADFRPTFVERLGLQRLLSPAARMILRQIERRPGKTMLSVVGMAVAAAILVVGDFAKDAIDYSVEHEFYAVQRYDLMVTFNRAASPGAVHEIRHLEGVQQVEPFRAIAARLRSGHRAERVGIMGLATQAALHRPADVELGPVELPSRGVVISAVLARHLDVGVGDPVTVDVLQDARPTRVVPVAGVIDDFAGMNAYMRYDAANRLLQQQDVASGVYLTADGGRIDALHAALKTIPGVAGVVVKEASIVSFHETIAKMMLLMRAFNVGFAIIIAFGVVYNSARISLAERSRELATLRVIGFTRREISFIQLGELAVLVVVGVPLGLALGYGLAAVAALGLSSDLFRFPLHVDRSTYGLAASVVVIAAVCSGLIVRRLIGRLDLVGVLKTGD